MVARRLTFLVLIMAVLSASTALRAGDLNPPAGPVAPTMKPLSDIEPRIAVGATNTPGDASCLFKITQPGSYYLTGNVTGVQGKYGIVIAASGVTLDLNGFELSGVSGAFEGVIVSASLMTNVTVRNGSVRGWSDMGVSLGAFNCSVVDVQAAVNGGHGISVGYGGTISRCVSLGNGGYGIYTNTGCSISGCSVYSNGAGGIAAGAGGAVTGCTATDNTGNGIFASSGATLSGCSSSSNTNNGISTSAGCTITACTTENNGADGITTTPGCTITGCSAITNTGNGISTTIGSTISNCVTRTNGVDGIHCIDICAIRDNVCAMNGTYTTSGAGIRVAGTGNRIEGNTCANADMGLYVSTRGNLIVRNSCSNNTKNWYIVPDNVFGPIVDRTAPGNPIVIGNSAPSSLGTTDANANFTY